MASSIVFAGTTIWSDSSTGVRRPTVRIVTPGYRKLLVFVPGFGTYIQKILGQEPGGFLIQCAYWVTGEEREALADALSEKNADVGVLQLNLNGGTESHNRMTLAEPAEFERTNRQNKFPGGSTKEEVYGIFRFQRLG